MNIVRKYNLTEEEKMSLDTVKDILDEIMVEEVDHFESILCNCTLNGFYRDYEKICKELTKEEN